MTDVNWKGLAKEAAEEVKRLRTELLLEKGFHNTTTEAAIRFKKKNGELQAKLDSREELLRWASDKMDEAMGSEDGLDGSVADELREKIGEPYDSTWLENKLQEAKAEALKSLEVWCINEASDEGTPRLVWEKVANEAEDRASKMGAKS